MKLLYYLLLLIVVTIIAYYSIVSSSENYQTGFVTRVIDGDTIVLDDGRTVRYIGIDTPEKDGSYTKYECYSEHASKKNTELVLNKSVKLLADIEEFDRYNRNLFYVYLDDGTFINELLVKEGYAESKAYPPNLTKQYLLDSAEKYAITNQLGLWNCIQ